MPFSWSLIVAASLTQPPPAGVDAAQFSRLVEGAQANIEDVTFLFEGSLIGLPSGQSVEEVLHAADPKDPLMIYQGSYAFRSDGASRLDTLVSYRPREADTTATPSDWRETFTLLKNEMQSVQVDAGRPKNGVRREPGGPGMLNRPNSPERILFLWYFQLLKRVGGASVGGYQDLGWEQIDGHRCLKVQLDVAPGAPARGTRRHFYRLWIDLARDGHPLKAELHDQSGLAMRISGIKLARFPLAGNRHAWLPVRGFCETFPLSDGQYTKEASAAETYTVIDGTVRFNQRLGNEQFTIEGGRKIPTSQALVDRLEDFRGAPHKHDPASVSRRLTEQLAAADLQSRQLEASALAGNRTLALQITFTVLGLIALMVALYIYRISR